ncbi:MAG: hypothetical protein LBR30_07880, partial [Clostridioides sp.]|nr:hypothetical protein [Clostridioides sp.]
MKKMWKKFLSVATTLVVCATMLVSNMGDVFANGQADGKINIQENDYQETTEVPKGYVTISFDANILGLGLKGLIKEPLRVPFYDGENWQDVVDRYIGKENIKYKHTPDNGNYVIGIKLDNPEEFGLRTELKISQEIYDYKNKVYSEDFSDQNIADAEYFNDNKDDYLDNADYFRDSVWVTRINNANKADVSCLKINKYKPNDGDVFRYQFSL